jgi:hypothetical protein
MAPQHAVHTLHLLHGQVPLHQPLDVHLAVRGKVGRGVLDMVMLQQQSLAELHLHASVQASEAVGDVQEDDGGGVLCPHQPQSPPCTVIGSAEQCQ